jgi:nicotinate-nucleotide adenylyltransferase
VVPAFLNPFKTNSLCDANTRLKWVKQVVNKFDKVKVIDFEVKNKKSTPSIQTVKYLKDRFNLQNIYLIIGADNLKSLNKWYKYDELKNLVEFVVVSRNNIEINHFKVLKVNQDISSTKIRNGFGLNFIPIEIKQDFLEIL